MRSRISRTSASTGAFMATDANLPPMKRPIHLLFDVMSTLVYDPFMVDLPAFLGMSFDELLASKHPTAWMEFERGEIDEATYLDKFFADGPQL